MLLAAPLIDLPAAYRLLSAMPSGLNSLVVAHAYGLDMEITAEAVTWSTAIVVAAPLAAVTLVMLMHAPPRRDRGRARRHRAHGRALRAARLRAGRAAGDAGRLHLAGTRTGPRST